MGSTDALPDAMGALTEITTKAELDFPACTTKPFGNGKRWAQLCLAKLHCSFSRTLPRCTEKHTMALLAQCSTYLSRITN